MGEAHTASLVKLLNNNKTAVYNILKHLRATGNIMIRYEIGTLEWVSHSQLMIVKALPSSKMHDYIYP